MMFKHNYSHVHELWKGVPRNALEKTQKADKMFVLHLPLVSSLQSIQKPTSLHSFAVCSSEEQAPFLQESNWQFFFLMFRSTYLLQFEKTLGDTG